MSRNKVKLFIDDRETNDKEIVFTGPRAPDELQPLCLGSGKFAGTDQPEMDHWLGKAFGFNSQGYIMPCCWTVQEKGYEEEQFTPLMKDKFHISKINDIKKEVFESDEWQKFADTLANEPNKAPAVCWFFCGKKMRDHMIHKPLMDGERVVNQEKKDI